MRLLLLSFLENYVLTELCRILLKLDLALDFLLILACKIDLAGLFILELYELFLRHIGIGCCDTITYNGSMRNILRRLFRSRFPYEPLITVEISRERLLSNLAEFRRATSGQAIIPVLKSNAYGHGLYEVASILKDDKAIPFFAIDSYFEAIALRSKNVRTPLLIIGYNRPETIETSKLKDVSFTITSLEMLQSMRDISRPTKIHLKIDTGMRRQGLLPSQLPEGVRLLKTNPKLILEGICTHFADADGADPSFTLGQIRSWDEIVANMQKEFPGLRYIHAANTAGMKYAEQIQANVSRLGIGLYRGVMEMRTMVTSVKDVVRDETVGYGNTYKAERDIKVATIPVGYYEGLDRRLSNKGFIQVGAERLACPIVGRVSMNMTSIDVSKVKDVRIGTEVVVISRNEKDPNSIESIAKLEGTIDYEVVAKIPAQLRRVLVE